MKTAGEPNEALCKAIDTVREAGKAAKKDALKHVQTRLDTFRKLSAIDEKPKEGEKDEVEEIPIPEQYIVAAMMDGWTFEEVEQLAEDNPERALRVLAQLYKKSKPKKARSWVYPD